MLILNTIYILFIIITVLFGKRNCCNECGLSKSNTNSAKGLLAVSILFYHLTGHTSLYILMFGVMGAIGVGCFFFLSGYGLVKASYKEHYFDNFLTKHGIKILVPYLLLLFCWISVFQGIFKESFNELFSSFKSGNPVSNSWYVYACLYCYLLYWISYKSKNMYSFALIILGLGIWIMIFAVGIKWPDWWYKTIICFAIGLAWGIYESTINNLIKKHYTTCVLVTLLMLSIAYMVPHFLNRFINGSTLWLVNDMAMGISGAIFLGVSIQNLSFMNKITNSIGTISYEVYLFHGFVIKIVEKLIGDIESLNLLYQEFVSIIILVLVLIISKGIHMISFNMVKKLNSKITVHCVD